MKKVILATAAAVLFTSCKLGDLGYNPSSGYSVLSNLANEMAYNCITLPITAINSFDRNKSDIFAEGFYGEVDCDQGHKLSIEKVPDIDSTWTIATLLTSGKTVVSVTLKMLPPEEEGFDLWISEGTAAYDEGNGYSAQLHFKDCLYSWEENMSEGSFYQKYLTAYGLCYFQTMRDKKEMDKGTLLLAGDRISTSYMLSGKLVLAK